MESADTIDRLMAEKKKLQKQIADIQRLINEINLNKTIYKPN